MPTLQDIAVWLSLATALGYLVRRWWGTSKASAACSRCASTHDPAPRSSAHRRLPVIQ